MRSRVDPEEPFLVLFRDELARFGPRGLRPREVEQVARSLGPLPASYRAFLRVAGRSCGPLWVGSDVSPPNLLELRVWAEEMLHESGDPFVLQPDDVPFLMHGGYVLQFLRGPGPDPPVWTYTEFDPAPQPGPPTFTALVRHAIADADRSGPGATTRRGSRRRWR